MRRAKLKRFMANIVSEAEHNPYDFWISREFPLVSEESFEGEPAQVEIDVLEVTDDSVHISISVDDGELSACFPVSRSTIIYREPNGSSAKKAPD